MPRPALLGVVMESPVRQRNGHVSFDPRATGMDGGLL